MFFFVSTSVHVSSNGSTLPTVPIIGTGKYIQLGDQSNKTTETNITPQETTRPYNSTYSTRNKSSTNLRGDYHSKLAACRVPGQRPLRPHPLRLSNRLNFFPVPDYLRAYVKEERMDEIVITEPSLGEVHNTKYNYNNGIWTFADTHTRTHKYSLCAWRTTRIVFQLCYTWRRYRERLTFVSLTCAL